MEGMRPRQKWRSKAASVRGSSVSIPPAAPPTLQSGDDPALAILATKPFSLDVWRLSCRCRLDARTVLAIVGGFGLFVRALLCRLPHGRGEHVGQLADILVGY